MPTPGCTHNLHTLKDNMCRSLAPAKARIRVSQYHAVCAQQLAKTRGLHIQRRCKLCFNCSKLRFCFYCAFRRDRGPQNITPKDYVLAGMCPSYCLLLWASLQSKFAAVPPKTTPVCQVSLATDDFNCPENPLNSRQDSV